MSNASGVAYGVLRAEYAAESERTAQPSRYAWTTPPAVSFLVHLFTLHALSLDGPESPLDGALARASAEVRRAAFELLGHKIRRTLPHPSVATRLQALFDRRLDEAAVSREPASYAGELATIGLWCDAPPGIDEQWLVVTIGRVLRLVGRIDAPHWVTGASPRPRRGCPPKRSSRSTRW